MMRSYVHSLQSVCQNIMKGVFVAQFQGMLKWPGAHCYDDNMIVVITRQFGIWKLSMV